MYLGHAFLRPPSRLPPLPENYQYCCQDNSSHDHSSKDHSYHDKNNNVKQEYAHLFSSKNKQKEGSGSLDVKGNYMKSDQTNASFKLEKSTKGSVKFLSRPLKFKIRAEAVLFGHELRKKVSNGAKGRDLEACKYFVESRSWSNGKYMFGGKSKDGVVLSRRQNVLNTSSQPCAAGQQYGRQKDVDQQYGGNYENRADDNIPKDKKQRDRQGRKKQWGVLRHVTKSNEIHYEASGSTPERLTNVTRNAGQPGNSSNAILGRLLRRRLYLRTGGIDDEHRFKPLAKFRQAARAVITLLKATRMTTSTKQTPQPEAKLLSFAQFQEEIANRLKSEEDNSISFDPSKFKCKKETQLGSDGKAILSLLPEERTDDQLRIALAALKTAVEIFGEFPIQMQQSLVKVGWYEHFESKRVIIRQGHTADNFYFIISGKAVVTILETKKDTGEAYVRTAALLKKGNSFGELALMHGATRSATVTCQDDVELLAVGREDFIDIFMHFEKDREPEHISYLRNIELMDGWPKEKLPYDDPKTCLFTYFRRGVVMCRDSNQSEWIYIIKTGSCRVLKALQAVQPLPSLPKKRVLPDFKNSKPSKTTVSLSHLAHHRRCTLPSKVKRAERFERVSKSCPNALFYQYYRPRMTPNTPETKRRRKHVKTSVANPEEEHKREIEEIFNQRHNKPQTPPQLPTDEIEKPEIEKPNKVFVQIQTLGPKDTFGLEHVAFSAMDGCPSVILVSDGAECILISKHFFLKHLSDTWKKTLRRTIQPYPSEQSLQQKLQDQTNWDKYKSELVSKYMHEKHLQDTLFL